MKKIRTNGILRFLIPAAALTLALLCFLMPARAAEEKKLTLMVYLCGSNLESLGGSASADLEEIKQAGFDQEEINVLAMIGGSSSWNSGYHADQIHILQIEPGRVRSVYSLETMSMGDPETLSFFISYAKRTAPAREYALIVWDHGEGPLGGVCLDDLFPPDRLSLSELAGALKKSLARQPLAWIGFDACLMGSAEVAHAVAPYAKYMIASQAREPGSGWDYSFLAGLEKDRDGAETGKRIVDAYLEAEKENADPITLACVDLGEFPKLESALSDYFYPIGTKLSMNRFPEFSSLIAKTSFFGGLMKGTGDSGKDLVDLKDLISRYAEKNDPSEVLSLLDSAIVCHGANLPEACGLCIYHPYSNRNMFEDAWSKAYKALNFCPGYTVYMENFGRLLTTPDVSDWTGLQTADEGFSEAGGNEFSLQLTTEQQAFFSSAQLMVLAYDDATRTYSPVSVSGAVLSQDGILHAGYAGRTLYVTDESGKAVAGPLAYRRSEDDRTFYLEAVYSDRSGREDSAPDVRVMLRCGETAGGKLTVLGTEVYDPLTETYSTRLSLRESEYTLLTFDSLGRYLTRDANTQVLRGFEEWSESSGKEDFSLSLRSPWKLQFFDTQQSGRQLYASFRISDVQQNSSMSELIPIPNPNLNPIGLESEWIRGSDWAVQCILTRDDSPLNPGMILEFSVLNEGERSLRWSIRDVRINGFRTATGDNLPDSSDFLVSCRCSLDPESLTNLSEITEISLLLDVTDRKTWAVETVPVSLRPVQCDVRGIAPLRQDVLAESDIPGAEFQLLSLSRNPEGDFAGTVRVRNTSAQDLYSGQLSFQLNSVFAGSSCTSVRILPQTEAILRITVRNTAILTGSLTAAGRDSRSFLSLPFLQERSGKAAVETLKVMVRDGEYKEVRSAVLPLSRPIPLDPPASVAAGGTFRNAFLLEGDVTAELDALVVTDNGVGCRFLLRNGTDRDLSVSLANWLLNGEETGMNYEIQALIGARSETYVCAPVQVARYTYMLPGYPITRIGLTFRMDQYTSPLAEIRFRTPVALGQYRGYFPDGTEILTMPVEMGKAYETAVTPFRAEAETYTFRASGGLRNTGGLEAVSPDPADRDICLVLNMAFENRFDRAVDITSTPLLINGTVETDRKFLEFGIQPGTAYEDSYGTEIPLEFLLSVDEIRDLSCTVNIRSSEDYSEVLASFPVSLSVSGADFSALREPAEPQAVVEENGLIWKLYSVSADQEGNLSGLLCVRNTTDQDADLYGNLLLAEGVETYSTLPGIRVYSGRRKLIPFVFENRIFLPDRREGTRNVYTGEPVPGLLQKLGHPAVGTLTFAVAQSGSVSNTPQAMITMKLPEPVALPAPEGPLETSLLLEAGDASVRLVSVLARENSLSMAFLVENRSPESCTCSVVEGYADHTLLQGASEYFSLLPESAGVFSMSMPNREHLSGEDRLEEISLSFHLSFDQERASAGYYSNAIVRLKEPFPLNGEPGRIFRPEDFSAQKAERTFAGYPGLRPNLGLPVRGSYTPKTLVAPVMAGKRASFLRGDVQICLRVEENRFWEDLEGYETRAHSYQILSVPLRRLESGEIGAETSGLFLSLEQTYPFVAARESEEEGGYVFRTRLQWSLLTVYGVWFDFVLPENPEEDPGLTPHWPGSEEEDGTEVYDEDYWEYLREAMSVGGDGDLAYHVRSTEEGLSLAGQEIRFREWATGKIRDYVTSGDGIDVCRAVYNYLDDDYDHPVPELFYGNSYNDLYPSLQPVESLLENSWFSGDAPQLILRYHVVYENGKEEILTAPYPLQPASAR